MSINPLGETMTEQSHTDTEKLAHRIAWRYKKSSDPSHSDTYTFNRETLVQFANALHDAERRVMQHFLKDISMTTKHTPGPWMSREINGRGNGWKAGPAWLGEAAHSDETAANAQLIAAAPEMLTALRKAVVVLAGACTHAPELEPHETYDAVSAAIAKATGQASGQASAR